MLTRKMLKAMSIEENAIDQIIEAHSETVEALKAERDNYKEAASKTAELESRLKASETSDWEGKYNKVKSDFEAYKEEAKAKELKSLKNAAYTALLKEIGISDKRINSVLKVSDIDGIELDADSKIKNVSDLKKQLSDEWSDFIVNEGEQGADTSNPPANNTGDTFSAMSLAEKMEYANSNPDALEVKEWLKN